MLYNCLYSIGYEASLKVIEHKKYFVCLSRLSDSLPIRCLWSVGGDLYARERIQSRLVMLLNEAALRQEQDKAILLPLILNTC